MIFGHCFLTTDISVTDISAECFSMAHKRSQAKFEVSVRKTMRVVIVVGGGAQVIPPCKILSKSARSATLLDKLTCS